EALGVMVGVGSRREAPRALLALVGGVRSVNRRPDLADGRIEPFREVRSLVGARSELVDDGAVDDGRPHALFGAVLAHALVLRGLTEAELVIHRVSQVLRLVGAGAAVDLHVAQGGDPSLPIALDVHVVQRIPPFWPRSSR